MAASARPGRLFRVVLLFLDGNSFGADGNIVLEIVCMRTGGVPLDTKLRPRGRALGFSAHVQIARFHEKEVGVRCCSGLADPLQEVVRRTL
jgi:hypothetical protein